MLCMRTYKTRLYLFYNLMIRLLVADYFILKISYANRVLFNYLRLSNTSGKLYKAAYSKENGSCRFQYMV